MSKSGEDCPAAVIAQYTWIEEQFALGENIQEICDMFLIDCDSLNQKDFFWFLSDIYTTAVQYGNRTGLCDLLIGNKDLSIEDQLQAVSTFG